MVNNPSFFLCKSNIKKYLFLLVEKHYDIYLNRTNNDYRDYKVLYASDLYVYSYIRSTSLYPSRIFMYSSKTFQLVKAFSISEFYYPVVIQNPYNSSIKNVIPYLTLSSTP